MGSSPATFSCEGRGTFLLWKIDGLLVLNENKRSFESKGMTFTEVNHVENGTKFITATVSVNTADNNGTQINCHATGQPGLEASNPILLTIAGKQHNT